MSESTYLVCRPRQVILSLGKPVRREDGAVDYFNLTEHARNSADAQLNKVLWKFLADCMGHPIEIKSSYDADFETVAAFKEIGGDEAGEVDFDEYTAGWSG